MKKISILLLILFSLFFITSCSIKENDAIKFKNEYESLNGKKNMSDTLYRDVNILEDNPFVYIETSKLIEKIDNKETFYVYFGDKMCPWCRSVIEESIISAKENNIDKIYYVNIWDDDHNEILRDKYTLTDDNQIELVNQGTEDYYLLLDYFKDVLADYTLTDKNNKKVEVGEKRIFAPNFIYIKNGEVISLIEGISDKQKAANDELTDDIIKDEKKIFNSFFQNK